MTLFVIILHLYSSNRKPYHALQSWVTSILEIMVACELLNQQ